jgi:hypothetical protein
VSAKSITNNLIKRVRKGSMIHRRLLYKNLIGVGIRKVWKTCSKVTLKHILLLQQQLISGNRTNSCNDCAHKKNNIAVETRHHCELFEWKHSLWRKISGSELVGNISKVTRQRWDTKLKSKINHSETPKEKTHHLWV